MSQIDVQPLAIRCPRCGPKNCPECAETIARLKADFDSNNSEPKPFLKKIGNGAKTMGEMPEKIWANQLTNTYHTQEHSITSRSHALPRVSYTRTDISESKLTEALAERDAIGRDLERQIDLNHAQLEEIERLRQLVGELSDDLAAEINERYPQDTREKYQSYQMKWERDMDPVLRARKALGKE